jgi:hypothetical protein
MTGVEHTGQPEQQACDYTLRDAQWESDPLGYFEACAVAVTYAVEQHRPVVLWEHDHTNQTHRPLVSIHPEEQGNVRRD